VREKDRVPLLFELKCNRLVLVRRKYGVDATGVMDFGLD